MKRRLRHGRPIGNNRPIVPTPIHVCQCYDCANGTCSDPITGFPRTGRLVSTVELRRHETLARSRGIASPKAAGAAIELSSPPELSLPTPKTLPDLLCPPVDLFPPSIPQNSMLPGNTESVAVRPHNQRQYNRSAVHDVFVTFRNLETAIQIQPQFTAYKEIVFSTPPLPQSKRLEPDCSSADLDQIWELKPEVPANMQLLCHQDRLRDSLKFVSESERKYGHLSTRLRLKARVLQRHFKQEITSVKQSLLTEWERQHWISLEVSDYYVDMTPYMNRTFMGINPYLLASYLVVLVLHLLCGLSMEHCKFVLTALNIMSDVSDSGSQDAHQGIRPTFQPVTDVRTVEKILMLDCSSNSFISCPKCSYLYPYHRDNGGRNASVPEKCTNRLHPDSEQCSRRLWRAKRVGGITRDIPTREFQYQSMKMWVGWMYSRPDVENLLDEDPTSRRAPGDQSELHDIWDASSLRDFKGPDGQSPFYKGPSNEGRLIFSLNMDGFNPYTNKEAGKKVSTGGIYMVCLNLPRSSRYKEENIYLVAIIPGPHEPSLHEINYLLKPLVDELIEFWDPGFFYSHTSALPQGRWVRCAIIPLVCDLPAARQMSGSAHYTANCFCSYCWLQLDGINDLDYSKWDLRTMGSHRMAAESWLNAPTAAKRDAIYSQFGTRWSELLRLPYWDPVRFTVIDPMHAFYLRIISRHCRDIWGMDASLPDADARRKETDPTEQEMKDANIILCTGTLTQLKSLKLNVLRELCIQTTTLKFRGRKDQLYARLVAYRHNNRWPAIETPEEKEASLNGDAKNLFDYASKSIIRKLTKEILLRILHVNVNVGGSKARTDYSKATNAELRSAIQEARQRGGIIDEDGKLLLKKPTKPKAMAVLGKDTLAEIRADMARTSLPSWFSAAPKHPGEKQWGKLTASNWRSFALVNLPITLIRLWGNEPKSSRKRQMLENYMHLVTAVKIATMHTVTASQISEYQEHMHAYLTSLLLLYPKTSITPYQHLSLHFGDLLERFGPTHAWHCFPFERYNHRMQQISTNKKFGEMEKTMFHRFRLSQLVRSFFHVPTLPSCLRRLGELYQKTFSTDILPITDNALPYDLSFNPLEEEVTWNDDELAHLSPVAYNLLKQWLQEQDGRIAGPDLTPFAFSRHHMLRLGQKFATSHSSLNNSHVLFHSSAVSQTAPSLRTPRDLLAGRIEEIFSHTRISRNGEDMTQTFVVVAPFKRLSIKAQERDLYREYPIVANQLFKSEMGEHLLLPMDQVISHFAHVPISLQVGGASLECIIAYPLNI